MYDLLKIEQEQKKFCERFCVQELIPRQRMNYVAIYRHLLEAKQMSDEELVNRARHIKPIIRLRNTHDSAEREIAVGMPQTGDVLVYTNPVDLHQSYTYNFDAKEIVCQSDGEPLPVLGLREVARFTCYHDYGGFYGFYRPGADEVLSQIPPSVNVNEVSAFEVMLESSNFREIYDGILDKHVSTAILYAIKGGLPEQVRRQDVICNEQVYPCQLKRSSLI